ncbi:hypothetical protein EN817_20115 [Mesorhizobium sp. M3A.F.Ca.ET.174.01.1.1]|uniref:cytochrome b561 domain-containing protein n=1 Tax=unclassified Mesorhizobium TaxID=325217 RepID=UPI000FE4E0CE|nr:MULTISPECIES: cytochrome b561 domain-containing protein [unclassified Mesorhizobium]RWB90729.1 MAG: hypothetical protein EOQ52_08920 [Mesorhizobium sp.]TGS64174.1 hypothetical protein EN844_21975 [Mesorhizobium sp. M3A.F.Ca.ET.201.01.1.1]TGS85897.1 hypothetical protein EN818_18225 [Mesorhizobium sp. M3A.F.Ca.ET.175.01.1.1]TGT23793.1 hypothetical protein EN817_20115 [Mesorhizobium sp. M3A.F.Ca.ET.174.01.1.1]
MDAPTTLQLPFGFALEAHWEYHAWLMFTIWIVLVPGIVLLTRYGKPPPSREGIPKGSPRLGRKLYWFTVHRLGLSLLAFSSLCGGSIALLVNGGLSATIHAVFGIATVVLGILQLVSARLRGTHGGPDAFTQSATNATVGRGDHYDMSPQRRWFEAYHKIVGYFTVALALGAVVTGLSQYWTSSLAIGLGLALSIWVVTMIVLEARGFHHDTYLSNFGTGARHPFNKLRIDQMNGD